MKLIEIKKFAPAVVLLCCLGVSSCVKDLDVVPIDPTLSLESDDDGIYNKCYSLMALAGLDGQDGNCDIDGLDGGTTGFVRQMFNANELTTDECICSWGDEGIPAFNFNQYNSSHPMLAGFYYRLYFGVTLCNFYLNECKGTDQQRAEIQFLRAYYYFHLLDCFGNVPFTTAVSSERPKQIMRPDLYKWVEQQLLECEPNLADAHPKTSADGDYGKADKAAAWLLLARLYLNASVYTNGQTTAYDQAARYAKKVMDSDYELNTQAVTNPDGYTWSAYQMLFMGDNGETAAAKEAILPLLQDGLQTTSWGCSLFLMASTFNADMLRYNGAGNGTSENWAGLRARRDLVRRFFPADNCPDEAETDEILAAAGDDRALLWGAGHTLSVNDPSDFTNGYGVVKFLNYYSDGGNTHDAKFADMDFFLMRKAEAYLTYAEALTRAAGDSQTGADATAAINVLRRRANAAERNYFTLNDILDEWSREFFYEGRRRHDLIRFGYYGGVSDYLWEWKGGSKEGTNFSANLNLFAIPEKEMNANRGLTQNPGY
ncbi:MAG: RagB/SusD family nutrient uptake outer membrane protein [Bacteroidaceae bacterium]|nr:RagB/SusD family nutrient uptake outer membrane protein [Bacteroidaceae bacterium]